MDVLIMASKYDDKLGEVKELHQKGLKNSQIALIVGVDQRRMADILRKLGLKKNERVFNDEPTKEEEEVLLSCIMGDGCLFKNERSINYRMNLAHSEKQKEYFIKKYEVVKEFIGVEYKLVSQFDKRTNKTYHAYKFQSKVNPYFTKMYDKWYKNGKKIMPVDITGILTPKLLAYKFFDDGFLNVSGFSISMDDYDLDSVSNYRSAMLENFGIETNIHDEGRKIYIPASQREKFKKLVMPFATKDVLYKLGELSGNS